MDTGALMARLLEKISPEPTSGCWLWTASADGFGYGQIHIRGIGIRRPLRAHRAMWLAVHGSLPPRHVFVCHKCDNPACCNPDHLFLGTNRDNVRDMYTKGRENYEARCRRMVRGEAHRDAKLCEADVIALRARHAAGETYRALALAFGVSKPTVAHACQGRSWAHVGRANGSRLATVRRSRTADKSRKRK